MCHLLIVLWLTELVVLLQLYYGCHVSVSILCHFLIVIWFGLQCGIVAFSGHTNLHFEDLRLMSVSEYYDQAKSHGLLLRYK